MNIDQHHYLKGLHITHHVMDVSSSSSPIFHYYDNSYMNIVVPESLCPCTTILWT